MSQTPKRWSIKGAVFAASLAVVFAACGTTASSPSASAPASTAPSAVAPSASAAAFDGSVYPETGEAPCGVAPYTGQLKKITAVDRLTVEFQLCGPAADFLPKIAFSAFGIQDSDYLDGARALTARCSTSRTARARTSSRNGAAATGWSGPRSTAIGATRP